MGKRNKIRYQSRPKEKILIRLTGNVYLRGRDEDAIATAVKGDLLVFPRSDDPREVDYYSTGISGYFKVDVHDGREWRAVLINAIFTQGQHRFRKQECPIDTYEACAPILRALAGTHLQRSYREHYEPEG